MTAIQFHCGTGCIGDAVTGLYAACGLADATACPVEYHTPQAAWLRWASHPRVAVVQSDDRPGPGTHADYGGELAAAAVGDGSRAEWYCRVIAAGLDLPPFTPARPARVEPPPPVIAGRYALLVPFSNSADRCWPPERWRELARLLTAEGRAVAATAGWWQARELARTFEGLPVATVAGEREEWAVSALAHAEVVVAPDSGMAHVAGLYGAETVAVMAQMRASWVFGAVAPSVRQVGVDGWGCSGCSWVRPCPTAAFGRCGALDSIPPGRIAAALQGGHAGVEVASIGVRRRPS